MINNPDTVCTQIFNLSKFNFNISLGCKVAVYLSGAIVFFVTQDLAILAPILAFIFVISSEVFLYISDRYKSIAEALRRKLDFAASLGWPVTRKDVAEVLVSVPGRLQSKWQLNEESYFISKDAVGTIKALANLEESSWWSKHLSIFCFYLYLAIVCLVLLLSIVAMYVSLNTRLDTITISKISKIVISSMMLLFSIGTIKQMIGHFKFHSKSEQYEMLAKEKLKSQSLTEAESIRIWSEYQIARASSPLIPTWVWNVNKDRLNELRRAGSE